MFIRIFHYVECTSHTSRIWVFTRWTSAGSRVLPGCWTPGARRPPSRCRLLFCTYPPNPLHSAYVNQTIVLSRLHRRVSVLTQLYPNTMFVLNMRLCWLHVAPMPRLSSNNSCFPWGDKCGHAWCRELQPGQHSQQTQEEDLRKPGTSLSSQSVLHFGMTHSACWELKQTVYKRRQTFRLLLVSRQSSVKMKVLEASNICILATTTLVSWSQKLQVTD